RGRLLIAGYAVKRLSASLSPRDRRESGRAVPRGAHRARSALSAIVDRVRTRVAQIQPTLPQGVTIVPFYDRTDLIRSTITTVARNLAEGGILVIVVLFLFLRNLRAGLVVASLIPLSMLVAFLGMRATGLSG